MVRITARIPVTMSAVHRNGTTVSFEQNPRNGDNFRVTLTAHNSTAIQDLEYRMSGHDYDAMDVPVRNAIRNVIRASPTRLDNGNEEYYLEDHDTYDDSNDPGGGGSVSYGVPTDLLDSWEFSVDYMAEGENAPLPVLDRVLRGAIRAPDSMYRQWDILAEAWTEAPEGENCMVTELFQAVQERVHTGSQKRDAKGAFVHSDAYQKDRMPKYSLEEWGTLTHDVELAEHPEKTLFEDDLAPNETDIQEIMWLRRTERQPELAAQVDEIAKWLHELACMTPPAEDAIYCKSDSKTLPKMTKTNLACRHIIFHFQGVVISLQIHTRRECILGHSQQFGDMENCPKPLETA
jgi:hypothetical protein